MQGNAKENCPYTSDRRAEETYLHLKNCVFWDENIWTKEGWSDGRVEKAA
jgi:hypothetical protein